MEAEPYINSQPHEPRYFVLIHIGGKYAIRDRFNGEMFWAKPTKEGEVPHMEINGITLTRIKDEK